MHIQEFLPLQWCGIHPYYACVVYLASFQVRFQVVVQQNHNTDSCFTTGNIIVMGLVYYSLKLNLKPSATLVMHQTEQNYMYD